MIALPLSTIWLLPTLQHARFAQCLIPQIDAAPALLLLLLKRLVLYDIDTSKETIECLLGGCTVLEALELDGVHGFNASIHIVSTTLQTIGLVCWSNCRLFFQLSGLVIKDAPLLERLIVFSPICQTSIMVINTPKLTFLGYSSDFCSELVIGSITLKIKHFLLMYVWCSWCSPNSGVIFLIIFLIHIRLWCRKWFTISRPRLCAQWRSWH